RRGVCRQDRRAGSGADGLDHRFAPARAQHGRRPGVSGSCGGECRRGSHRARTDGTDRAHDHRSERFPGGVGRGALARVRRGRRGERAGHPLCRRHDLRPHRRCRRGAVDLWTGHADHAATFRRTRRPGRRGRSGHLGRPRSTPIWKGTHMSGTDRIPPSPQLTETGVMAILRARSAERFADISKVLVDAGITCLEITLTSPGAVEAISTVRAQLPDTVDVGAGTVVDAEQARAVVEAGAGFVVSPSVEPEVLRVARDAGIPAYPGAFTPTEILAAWRGGAAVVKLFPGSALGPSYITSVAGPFPDIAIMPTGGVSLTNIGE